MSAINQGGQVAKILALSRHLQGVAASGKNPELVLQICKDLIVESDILCRICNQEIDEKSYKERTT